MKTSCRILFALLITVATSVAQVPGIVNYQGRVTVGGTNFDGTGQFKFALIKADGSATYWANGPGAVPLTVSDGSFSVLLGDTSLPNMTAPIPASTFTNADVRLRVWFNDEQISPDLRVGSVGYALMAADVPDGIITSNKLAAGSVSAAALANGTVGSAQLGVLTTNLVMQQGADPSAIWSMGIGNWTDPIEGVVHSNLLVFAENGVPHVLMAPDGTLALPGDVRAFGGIEADGHLSVKGGALFNDQLEVWTADTNHPAAIINGQTCIDGELEVSGDTLVDGHIQAGGGLHVGGSFTAQGISKCEDQLEVRTANASYPAALVYGETCVFGKLSVSGETVIGGDLIVNGTKYFVQSHPTDATKEIAYACLEGPESGTYVRGSAEMVNGKAVIALPDHFGMVTGAKGLTVQLTPRGSWMELYVTDATVAQVTVAEAQARSGRFDYLVQGVRLGYEDRPVIRERRAAGEK